MSGDAPSPGAVPGARLARWRLLPHADGLPVIMLVLDDDLGVEPTRRMRGEWGTGQRDGSWLVGFRLFDAKDEIERLLFTDQADPALLETILDVPHLVVVAPRRGEPVVARVDVRSNPVARLHSPRGTN